MAGKGDVPRPLSVDKKTFDENWERTFKCNHILIEGKCTVCLKQVEETEQ